jgi:hypothetical protein
MALIYRTELKKRLAIYVYCDKYSSFYSGSIEVGKRRKTEGGNYFLKDADRCNSIRFNPLKLNFNK